MNKVGTSLDQLLLRVGFFTGLFFAFLCLAFCVWYLVGYQAEAGSMVKLVSESAKDPSLSEQQLWLLQNGLTVHMFTSRVLLQSCGVVAGIAFGFLGFSLFLLGLEGQTDVAVEDPRGLKVNIAKLAPGALILLVAAVLVGVCSTTRIPVSFDTQSRPGTNGASLNAQSEQIPHFDTQEPGNGSIPAAKN
jgi:hypothetical protein